MIRRGRADVAVRDREGRTVLVVDVKSRSGVTASWAARTFRNLFVHGSVPDVAYFMLASTEAFYLWKDPGRKAFEALVEGHREEVDADFTVPAWELIRPYLGGNKVSPGEVSGYALEMVVSAFLADILNADLSLETVPDDLRWLFDSGLYEAARGGNVASQAAV